MSAVATPKTWLEEHREYIGATHIGAILGCNPYVSEHDAWLFFQGRTEDKSNIPMRAGLFMEPFIASEYEREFGVEVRESRTYRSEAHPFLGCNPDREFEWQGHPALLECKRVGHWAARNFGQDGSDQIPEHYLMQVLWQLTITRKKVVVLYALLDDRECKPYIYSLDPSLSGVAHIFDKAEAKRVYNFALAWWNRHIVQGVEPPMSGHDSDRVWVGAQRETYENGQKTNTDAEIDAVCVGLRAEIEAAKAATEIMEASKNQIKKYMADQGASVLESSVGDFTWRTNVKGVAVFKPPFTNKDNA